MQQNRLSRIIPGICLCALFLITFIAYYPGLSGPLILDDHPNLFPLYGFNEGLIGWKDTLVLSPNGTSRPVSIISFIANWMITDGDVLYLKLTNLVIHLLCGLVIYQLSRLLLNRSMEKDELHARYIALWIAGLWLLSPFLMTSVLYVVQRMTQLSALFTFCGLLSYVAGRINYENKKSPAIGLIAVSLAVFWPLAAFSKQNGVLLPLLILITEYYFFREDMHVADIKKLRVILWLLVCIPGLIVIGIIFFSPGAILAGYAGRDFTLYERVLTQPRVLFDYIGNLLLIPWASPMSLFHDDYVKSTGLLNPVTTLPCIILTLVILVCGFYSLGRKYGPVLFGIVFFYAAHLVESSFIPLELYFEHRNYVPAFGIYFSIVTAIALLLPKLKFRKIALVVLLIAPLSFSILTRQRSTAWQTTAGIFFLSELTHPDSARVNEGIAYLYLSLRDPDRAIRHLDRVLEINPHQQAPEFYFKYLLAYCQRDLAMNRKDFAIIQKISNLSNKSSTVIYFREFIDAVEAGQCDSLDLEKIAGQFSIAIENRDRSFDIEEISYVHILQERLESYINK